jgi:hypothetical protein
MQNVIQQILIKLSGIWAACRAAAEFSISAR